MSGIVNFQYQKGKSYLFGRSYAVIFGAPSNISGPAVPGTNTGAFQYGNIPSGTPPTIAPLRVVFDIDRNMYGASPNHSKISIYNLSPQSRQKISKGFLVQVRAGYANLIGTIFTGNVYIAPVLQKDHGQDTVTTFECLDGGEAITMARLDKAYPSGTLLTSILSDLISAMNVDTGIIADFTPPILPGVVFSRGITISGACRETLDKLLRPHGMEWNIQDGNFNIVPLNSAYSSKAEVVSSGTVVDPTTGITTFNISKATGLIGVPSKNIDYVGFTALLNPRLLPGALVQLSSENSALNGYYKIRRSHFEGDSHDNKWQVTCEAIPISDLGITVTQL